MIQGSAADLMKLAIVRAHSCFVGALTIAMLMKNTVAAAKARRGATGQGEATAGKA